jgi:hypothetical protein
LRDEQPQPVDIVPFGTGGGQQEVRRGPDRDTPQRGGIVPFGRGNQQRGASGQQRAQNQNQVR